MGHDDHQSDSKSQLVTEICSISKLSVACSHRHCTTTSLLSSSSPFVDWYRLLGVEETAGIDVIRKRYHELALQLHPDKNKHAKAEVAFKLVSEAYSCLSDNENRRAFDLERWSKFCFKCGTIPYTTYKAPRNAKTLNPTSRSRSYKVVKSLKDIRNRFREEATVIENCLRTNNAASRNESSRFSPPDYVFQSNFNPRPSRETPVFNPSDHVLQGYPHLRTRIYDKEKSRNFWCMRTGHHILNYDQGRASRATYDTPVFEVRSERGILKSRSACVRS